jgi:2-polyprenyl-6-methoxyphenol hydroxylase-like FAD-dependent oxidoreductase
MHSMNPINPAQQAIVIGGSITGLLVARVLSDHFNQVFLIERDKFNDQPEVRKGQPHAQHLHALLASGREILERYFPDLINSLQEGGAILADMGQAARWYIAGGYRLQYHSGMTSILLSRPFLEYEIRRRVMMLPNITVLDGYSVEGLMTTPERSHIVGVRLKRFAVAEDYTPLQAALVVDACGRGSASLQWLSALGYAKPPETVVKVGLAYASRIYHRQPGDLPNATLAIVSADPPHCPRSGVIFPIECDRWMATLASWGEDHPPLDEETFLDFTHHLPAPDVYNILRRAEPLSGVISYKYPASLRRHYEKLRQFPSGYLVMGDAFCSFDPAYGQGMTSAALQATVLDELLRIKTDPQQLARQFFKRAAKIVDIPWQLAVGEDFRFPTTQGKKPLGADFLNAYVGLVHRATHVDPVVYERFLKIMNLQSAPSSLFHPKMIWRVLQAQRKRNSAPQPDASLQQA